MTAVLLSQRLERCTVYRFRPGPPARSPSHSLRPPLPHRRYLPAGRVEVFRRNHRTSLCARLHTVAGPKGTIDGGSGELAPWRGRSKRIVGPLPSVGRKTRRLAEGRIWPVTTSPVVGPSLISATGPEIWIYDLNRNALERITFAPGEEEVPVWSPDGKRIAYPMYPMYPTVESRRFGSPGTEALRNSSSRCRSRRRAGGSEVTCVRLAGRIRE
jgi:WD40 repeat protein